MAPKVFKYDVKDAVRVRGSTPSDADKKLKQFFEAIDETAYRMGISIQRESFTREQTDK